MSVWLPANPSTPLTVPDDNYSSLSPAGNPDFCVTLAEDQHPLSQHQPRRLVHPIPIPFSTIRDSNFLPNADPTAPLTVYQSATIIIGDFQQPNDGQPAIHYIDDDHILSHHHNHHNNNQTHNARSTRGPPAILGTTPTFAHAQQARKRKATQRKLNLLDNFLLTNREHTQPLTITTFNRHNQPTGRTAFTAHHFNIIKRTRY